MIHQVLQIGDPILNKTAELVVNFSSPQLISLVDELFENMEHWGGVGIAAPQIGVSKRIFVYGLTHSQRYPDAPPIDYTVMINPRIINYSSNTSDYNEGCLSVPDLRGKVIRPSVIEVEYQDIYGNVYLREISGFEARIVQHELDHLDGVLFPMRMVDKASLQYNNLV